MATPAAPLFQPNANPLVGAVTLPTGTNPANNYTAVSGNSDMSGADLGIPKANNRVVVNLHMNISVQGDIDLHSASGEVMSNVIVATVDADAAAFYMDGSTGVIEFWDGSGSDRGQLFGCVSSQNKPNLDGTLSGSAAVGADNDAAQFNGYDTLRSDVHNTLNTVINGGMNAQAAAPFNLPKYAGIAEYQFYDSFGEVALANYAHYLLGHVAATAAIDNQTALVAYMNGNGTSADSALIGQNLATALGALTPQVAASIANQVISQDPSRARGQDNNQAQNDVHQTLIFAPGDIVYVQVTIDAPTLTVGQRGNVTPSASDTTARPPASTVLPAQGAGSNTAGVDGAPASSTDPTATTNLLGSVYPSVSPTFAIQITLA